MTADSLILRDGTTAVVRPAVPSDAPDVRELFDRLSPESRRHRFFTMGQPPESVIADLCAECAPDTGATLVVTRFMNGQPRIIATASYFKRDDETAEIALAVDDAFHHQGIGTGLLDRLALLAVRHDIRRLWAVTHLDNLAMLAVFRDSGYEVTETLDGGDVLVEVSTLRTERSSAQADIRDRLATTASLLPLFRPRAVAVIGASRHAGTIGARLLKSVVQGGYAGPIYPVNPHGGLIGGLQAYGSVKELPTPVDVALIAVPCDAVPAVIEECGQQGVRAVCVITAGFAEVGAQGAERQRHILDRVRGYGMRMVGPNCFGLINGSPAVRLNATFGAVMPAHGHVALSSQSGALGLALLAAADRLALGLSSFVSIGNKADVSTNDLLQYWESDPDTEVIVFYVESFGNPRRFARIARRVARTKPIVAMKAGRSGSGQRAAGSHTAALAANDVAVDALFRQSGVMRADSLEDLGALATALAHQPLPAGRRVAIVTNAGGPAILCADACEAGKLSVPELSETVQQRLRAAVPRAASVKNPVDLIASATPVDYRRTVSILLDSDEVDAIIVIYVSLDDAGIAMMTAGIADGVADGRGGVAPQRPVLACVIAGVATAGPLVTPTERIPVYGFPELPARVLGQTAAYAAWRRSPPGIAVTPSNMDLDVARSICRRAAERGTGWLSAADTHGVLHAVGLSLPAGGFAASPEEAVTLAERVGFPVAVKLASRRIVHKSEVDAVKLGLRDAEAVRRSFEAIRERVVKDGESDAMDGVVVQPMLGGAIEVMAGITQDDLFGPLVAFGLGGVHVEVLGDVQFRVTPLTDRDAADMVRGIRGARLLEGYRGKPAADIAAIEDLLLRLSRLAETVEEIRELDLNPVFAQRPGDGCIVADARIRVARHDAK